MLTVKRYKVGALNTNCYLVIDEETQKAAIIDPGGLSSQLDKEISSKALSVEYILLTHGHFDHIRKVVRYKNKTNAKVIMSMKERDFPMEPDLNLSGKFAHTKVDPFDADILFSDGDKIALGNSIITMISTPGHTRGGSCFIIGDCIFTGDTLMKQSVGRTDFATGNPQDMLESLSKIISLSKNYTIYPGHGDGTTLNFEKNNNIYLMRLNQNKF